MHIRAATMHQLKKVQFSHGENVVDIVERKGLLANDEVLSNVCVQTMNLFDKKGNNTGTFGDVVDLHRFPVRLKEYRSDRHDFEAFSKLALAILAEEMADVAASNGGHYFFVHYEQSGNEHLLVAVLKLREGAGIDEDLSLLPTLTIDTSKLHEAARINLTRWEAGVQPYLTFVKKRGEDKVTRYFRKALACTNYTSSQYHTLQVIEAAKEYVMSRPNTSDEERRVKWDAVRTSLHSAFVSCKGEIVLDAIAIAVEPEEPGAFSDFVAEGASAGKYSFDHAFKPHASTYKSLKRIKSHVGTVSLAFDLSDVKEGRVTYDQKDEVLIIQSNAISQDLKQQVIDSVIAGT